MLDWANEDLLRGVFTLHASPKKQPIDKRVQVIGMGVARSSDTSLS